MIYLMRNAEGEIVKEGSLGNAEPTFWLWNAGRCTACSEAWLISEAHLRNVRTPHCTGPTSFTEQDIPHLNKQYLFQGEATNRTVSFFEGILYEKYFVSKKYKIHGTLQPRLTD